MKITVNGEVHQFDPNHLTNVEGMAIEKVTGMIFGDWSKALASGSMLAQTALMWIVLKRSDPTLRFSDVSYDLGDIDIDDSEDAPTQEPPTPSGAEQDQDEGSASKIVSSDI